MATDNTTALSGVHSIVEVRSSMYEAAALAQGEVVQMIKVRNGECVVDLIVDADALGSSSSYSVGDGANAARFVKETTSTSATTVRLNSAADVGRMYKYTGDDTIDLTVVGSGAITGTVRVTALILRTFN
jgi:hypothetical protein